MDGGFWTGPRKAAAAIAGVVVVLGAVAALEATGVSERLFASAGNGIAAVTAPRGSAKADAIAAELERLPDIGGMYREMRSSYPDEYRAFVERVATVADESGEAAAEQEAFHFMRRFMTGKVEAAANAPDADLQRLARANVALVEALQRSDAALCAQYVTVGFSPFARPGPEALEQLGEMNVLQLRAARAGERAGAPPRPQLAPADAEAWFSRMEAIDSGAAAQIRSGEVEELAPAEQCAAGLVIYQAAADLPVERSAAVTAHLMRSAAQSVR